MVKVKQQQQSTDETVTKTVSTVHYLAFSLNILISCKRNSSLLVEVFITKARSCWMKLHLSTDEMFKASKRNTSTVNFVNL